MKRLLSKSTLLLVPLLFACAKVEQLGPQTQADPDELPPPTLADLEVLDQMELARLRALQIVNRLIEQGDPDSYLGRQIFCSSSAFVCDRLRDLDEDGKRAFIQEKFLNREGFLKEKAALLAARMFVTSDATKVMIAGKTYTARAEAAKNEIRFYRPWVEALKPIERVALLLHEIWHLLGLPDEGEFGKYATYRAAIDAAASAQAAYQMGYSIASFPPTDPSVEFGAITYLQNWVTKFPLAGVPLSSVKHNNFELWVSYQTVNFMAPAEAHFRMKVDSQGRHYAYDLQQAVGAGWQGQLRYFDGTSYTDIASSNLTLRIVFWNGRLKFINGPNLTMDDYITSPGGFAWDCTNASCNFTVKSMF